MINIIKEFGRLTILIFLVGLTACGTQKSLKKDFIYFQNDEDIAEVHLREPLIQANDMLNIQIISKSTNQHQTDIFNAPAAASGNAGGLGYMVSMAGVIDMPIIGSIKAVGLTRTQLEAIITEKLEPYVKDPSVFIKLLPFNINILGEVKVPGQHTFTKDRVTIIDAISSAGDLTDNGKRENVLVIREDAGKRKYFNVDLRSRSLFKSPVYQLQANDIVYVEPDEIKLKSLNVDPAGQRNWQRLLSILSLVTTFISIGSVVIAVSK